MTIRTPKMNNSLHRYLTIIAEQLADSGQDMRQIVKLPITPTMENVKENMFHPVMTALFPEVESTADLTTVQMQKVYEVFNEALAQRLGVSAEWPSIENQINQSRVE